jgi:hypothetical protein
VFEKDRLHIDLRESYENGIWIENNIMAADDSDVATVSQRHGDG